MDPRSHWVFDLDGTLVHDTHDYGAIKARLGCPRDHGILEHLDALAPADRAAAEALVDDWEVAHADAAVPYPDAIALLDALRHARVGILTRNTRAIALRTLRAAGLADRFDPALVLGRDTAAPKPSPEGITALLAAWGASPADAVMVGDGRYDVLTGRAAGVYTVLVARDAHADAVAHLADRRVTSLAELAP